MRRLDSNDVNILEQFENISEVEHIEREYCNNPDLPLARYCPLCGFYAPPHDFAFDKSRDDSQSSARPLVKTRLIRERNLVKKKLRSQKAQDDIPM
ncbi:hypothetical protein PIB30_082581 [Stylosanthes scabra]|uniref:Uncharacterized protein n=1 Tax=Stylosanthes scabra TaxID=79078 RepID=A0ABU6SSC3_9FABA|nr:hypothetical protein [Stylosanthes scabra]